jgi:hypothetical protein
MRRAFLSVPERDRHWEVRIPVAVLRKPRHLRGFSYQGARCITQVQTRRVAESRVCAPPDGRIPSTYIPLYASAAGMQGPPSGGPCDFRGLPTLGLADDPLRGRYLTRELTSPESSSTNPYTERLAGELLRREPPASISVGIEDSDGRFQMVSDELDGLRGRCR